MAKKKFGCSVEEIGFSLNLLGKLLTDPKNGGENPGQIFVQDFSHDFSRSNSPPPAIWWSMEQNQMWCVQRHTQRIAENRPTAAQKEHLFRNPSRDGVLAADHDDPGASQCQALLGLARPTKGGMFATAWNPGSIHRPAACEREA